MNAERFPTQEVARIEVYGRMEKMVAKLKNLSATGAFFELINGDYVPKPGDFIRFSVSLQSINRIHEVDAEVVWHQALGFGVNFIRRDDLLTRMMTKSS